MDLKGRRSVSLNAPRMPPTPEAPDLSPLVARMRWVLMAAIAGSAALALACQPAAFWSDPANAIRGDLLPVDNPLNHTFSFFLAHGPLPFVAANAVYAAGVFLLVSRLPAVLALAAIFGGVFAHGYGTTNWIANRFQLGAGLSPALTGVWFGVLFLLALQPTGIDLHRTIRGWRWLMIAVLVVDVINTLAGQPPGYWLNPAVQREGNTWARFFLGYGWAAYVGYGLGIAAGELLLLEILPTATACVFVLAATFGNFAGGSNWFFYEWRLGWLVPAAYAGLVGLLLVLTAPWGRRGRAAARGS